MDRFLQKRPPPPPTNNNNNVGAGKHNSSTTSTTEVIDANSIGQHQNTTTSSSGTDLYARNTHGNVEAVSALFDLAKLSNLMGEVQQIEFASPFVSGDYRLMQVSPQLADQIQHSTSSSLVFRGELDDCPVMCTEDTTYTVKEAETSNTLLILPNLSFSNPEPSLDKRFLTFRKVITMQSKYLELKKAEVVSLNRLKELLRESELQWDDADEEMNKENMHLYRFEDLLDVVQMSELQLKEALENLPIIRQNGFLRMLSSSYRDQLLMELTDCCDDDEEEPLIQIHSIRLKTFSDALKRRHPTKLIPSEAIEWLLKSHCRQTTTNDDSNKNADNGIEKEYALDERMVCRSKISQLLRAAVRFEYSAFEKLIQQMLPDGIEMKEEYLNGLALIEESVTRGKTIRYMNVEDMPEEQSKRLQLLFSIRPKWKLSDIQHFFTDLCPTNRALNEMLTKYCRHSMGDGERYLVGLK